MVGFRQILVVLGVILLIRMIGKIMSARRQVNEQNRHNQQESYKQQAKKNVGKTTIQKIDKSKIKESDYTDFEEID